nr:hypothetical protein CFP56_19458 [Quercus suber]
METDFCTAYLINTGIHSPKKYPNEPFRWGRDGPHKPQAVDDPGSSVIDAWIQSAPPSLPSDALMTGVYTDMATTTVEPVGGLSTLPGVLPDLDFASSVQSISTSTSIPIPASTTVLACASSGTPFAQPAAQNLISTFCADPMLDVQLVPYIAMGNVSNQLGQTKSLTGEGHFTLDGNTDVIWFRIRFTREACMGSFNGAYQCADRFSTILNGCQTNTINAKLGGTLSVDCAEYDLTVVDAHTDPFTDDDSSVGDFTCEDTSSPVADLYPNTCTCWMSERADQTAIFVKPANGACDGNNVDQVNGLAPGQGY